MRLKDTGQRLNFVGQPFAPLSRVRGRDRPPFAKAFAEAFAEEEAQKNN